MKKITQLIYIPILVLTILTLMFSCKQKITCSTWDVPPPSSLALVITQDGMILPDSIKSQIKFFHLDDFVRIDLELLTNDSLMGEYIQNKGFVVLDERIYELFRKEGVKNYYFEFPDGSVDSLYLNMEYVETCQAKLEKCYCEFPIRNVTYNGKEAKEHELSWNLGTPLYVLER